MHQVHPQHFPPKMSRPHTQGAHLKANEVASEATVTDAQGGSGVGLILLEARAGVEPANKGFADLSSVEAGGSMGKRLARRELFQDITVEREALNKLPRQIKARQMTLPGVTPGGWSVTDILAHVVGWQGRILKWHEATAR